MSTHADALRAIVGEQPENHALRRALADLLSDTGCASEAVEHYVRLHTDGQLDADARMSAAQLALALGATQQAQTLLAAPAQSAPDRRPDLPERDENAAPAGDSAVDGHRHLPPHAVADPTDRTYRGDVGIPDNPADLVTPADTDGRGLPEAERSLEKIGPGTPRGEDFIETGSTRQVAFDDVGGLRDVKKVIERLIIKPLRNPGLFERYGKSAGGGVLLYGPPGCGKTLIARATAGEVGLPFYNLRIEDIVDPYFGVSEQRLVAAFEAARQLRPCILFIDEVDGLGFARSKRNSDRGRALVEVMLQQFDSAGVDNTDLLVLAASNEPWDIDSALLRPGRFDRTIFVPPPDDDARLAILERAISRMPHDRIDLRPVVKATALFSGADIAELVDRAAEEALDEALERGGEPPLTQRHVERALTDMRATTLPWLARARNHADFGNIGGRWDDVKRFVESRSVARRLRDSGPGGFVGFRAGSD